MQTAYMKRMISNFSSINLTAKFYFIPIEILLFDINFLCPLQNLFWITAEAFLCPTYTYVIINAGKKPSCCKRTQPSTSCLAITASIRKLAQRFKGSFPNYKDPDVGYC
ncbi:uncharacterized protein F4822DRAFT_420666 [Hypoxylon trugodes]|uniref:uncharacterized protein n=1 Tax=Hypoxylon trugodes TaxID=326681 RepID=UPI0021902827|nr:uncharacterized protein F4822DRAFT_420666 [Hypoxylon trugodes]KAI1383451.1 hypothetical protein F4822DRAFT_420666 [Hypoxylon trugodes]